MRIRVGLLLTLLLVAPRAEAQFNAPNPPPGEDFRVEVGLMYWKPTPDIRIQTGALAAIGESEVDFVQEFGVENKRFREFRAVLKPGRKHKLRFDYVPIEYNAETTLNRTITFGGRTFMVGLPATGDLKWQLWKFGYEWDLVSGDGGFVGIIGGLKYNKISARLNSPIAGGEITEAKAPVPTLGVIGRGYPSRNVSITAEFTGFMVPDSVSDQFDAKILDFDIYATVNFGRYAGVQGGYRSLTAEYLVDDDAGHFKLKGLYFGGLLRF
jgi:hypothetical protein